MNNELPHLPSLKLVRAWYNWHWKHYARSAPTIRNGDWSGYVKALPKVAERSLCGDPTAGKLHRFDGTFQNMVDPEALTEARSDLCSTCQMLFFVEKDAILGYYYLAHPEERPVEGIR